LSESTRKTAWKEFTEKKGGGKNEELAIKHCSKWGKDVVRRLKSGEKKE